MSWRKRMASAVWWRCERKFRRTQENAEKEVEYLNSQRQSWERELHAYLCPDCGWWHVGHVPREEVK